MGLHVNDSLGFPEAVTYCANVKPAIMKWLAPSKQVLQDCRRVSPGTKHVLRPYWSDQQMGSPWDAFIRHTMDRVSEFGQLIDWYEGYNEVGCQDHSFLRSFCNAEIGRAKKLNEAGVGAALGGFSTGAFDQAGKAYDAVKPMLQFLHATGPRNVWHSHEYAGPYMQYMCRTPGGKNQWDHSGGGFTGASADGIYFHNLDGWLTLRYRMLWARLVADKLTGVRMIFTETGIDDTNPRPGGANMKGWRDYDGTEWSQIPGIGDYAAQQRWYGYHLSHDAYVLGWCDFGFGTRDPAWNSFDLLQTPAMLARVAQEQKALIVGHDGGDPVTPVPAPNPVPPVIVPPVLTVRPAVEVLRGDGWWSIARRCYGSPTAARVAALREANGDLVLVAGMRLWVPGWKAVRE